MDVEVAPAKGGHVLASNRHVSVGGTTVRPPVTWLRVSCPVPWSPASVSRITRCRRLDSAISLDQRHWGRGRLASSGELLFSRTERLDLADGLGADIIWHIVEVDDEVGKLLPVVSLPLADRLQILCIALVHTILWLLLGSRPLVALFRLVHGRHGHTGSPFGVHILVVLIFQFEDLFLGRRLSQSRVSLSASALSACCGSIEIGESVGCTRRGAVAARRASAVGGGGWRGPC
ncbi:hypothetical protein KC340_g19 [Hortaea werneckii]|nr:hypothetical protein KC340_g19 [Hortaea werneckii]